MIYNTIGCTFFPLPFPGFLLSFWSPYPLYLFIYSLLNKEILQISMLYFSLSLFSLAFHLCDLCALRYLPLAQPSPSGRKRICTNISYITIFIFLCNLHNYLKWLYNVMLSGCAIISLTISLLKISSSGFAAIIYILFIYIEFELWRNGK